MEKNTKRFATLILVLSIIFTMIIPATAAEPQTVQPRMVGISNMAARLEISSSGKASCIATLYNNGTYDVTIIIILTQDGTPIKSWSAPAQDQYNALERFYYVTSGHDYQVTVKAEVRSNGSLERRYSISSSIVHY